MEELQTLKFFYLKYETSAIRAMINSSPGIDSFVFSYFFAATDDDSKPLQLIAYGHMSPSNLYSSYYDTLEDYNNNALELSGPLIMSNNVISLADMEKLINTTDPEGDKPDYLVFIPDVNDTHHIYYDVQRYKRVSAGDVQLPGDVILDGINTNPSPPATING